MLILVRSIKNSLAPIHRLPLELLSFLPDYFGEDSADQDLIALTHVCRGWREAFISRPSLWTKFEFENVDKTRTYIQRSQSSPFKIYLGDDEFIDDAFALVIPHIHRLKTLTVNAQTLPGILAYLCCHAPLLEELHIELSPLTVSLDDPVLDSALFRADLASLRELHLKGVATYLPWKNLVNLWVFELTTFFFHTTQILDFFESAPLLHTIRLEYSEPDPPDAPPERIVPLRHLKDFTIRNTDSQHSILLRHLHIPIGASLDLWSNFPDDESLLQDCFPARSHHFNNLSHITTINLLFGLNWKFLRFSGPSGSLRVLFECHDSAHLSCNKDHQILGSLDHLTLSKIHKLTISKYKARPTGIEECPIFQTLSSTNDLQTLILIDCNTLPFVLALDPEQNPSNLVLCPNMQNVILYIQSLSPLIVGCLTRMTKNRASREAKLSSVILANMSGRGQGNEASELIREHVTHVECRVGGEYPDWDSISVGGDGESE